MHYESLHPAHTGTERYAVVVYLKDQGDQYDVKGKNVTFMIRPERVILIWERQLRDGFLRPWRRRVFVARHTESRIVGPRVLKDRLSDKQDAYVTVFASEELGDPLSPYAESLPGLPEIIAELEKNLPA